jgi:hypothetical protein
MTASADEANFVRERAGFACEYCGVSEADTGGELTIDHYRPQAYGGTHDTSNLVYCCYRCNLYKSDYWPLQPNDPLLWNPRRERVDAHLLALVDGRLHAVSAIGAFTLERLHLNRWPLVQYRLRKQSQMEESRLLKKYRDLVISLEQVNLQYAASIHESRELLAAYRTLLRLLLDQ